MSLNDLIEKYFGFKFFIGGDVIYKEIGKMGYDESPEGFAQFRQDQEFYRHFGVEPTFEMLSKLNFERKQTK